MSLKLKIDTSNELTLAVDTSDNAQSLSVKSDAVNALMGTNNYEDLTHKPQINSVELKGNKSFEDLGDTRLTNTELQSILDNIF